MNRIRQAKPQVDDDDSDIEQYSTSRIPKQGAHYPKSASPDKVEEMSDARSDSEAEEQEESKEGEEEEVTLYFFINTPYS